MLEMDVGMRHAGCGVFMCRTSWPAGVVGVVSAAGLLVCWGETLACEEKTHGHATRHVRVVTGAFLQVMEETGAVGGVLLRWSW